MLSYYTPKGLLMASDTVRLNVTLPRDICDLLDDLSSRLGLSRSGLISALLVDSYPMLERLQSVLPPVGDTAPESLKRFRGESKAIFDDLLAEVMSDAPERKQDWGFLCLVRCDMSPRK